MSRDEVQEERRRNTSSVCGSKQVELEIERGQQLLPGIPDEITLDLIASKLPWTAFYLLSSVSRAWRRAIRSHQVYDARVRSKSTQAVVALVPFSITYSGTILLYSMEDFSCYRLPPIPDVGGGYPCPSTCQCISLDGRLYLLGGLKDSRKNRCLSDTRPEIYVIDIAGGGRWEQCASMKESRMCFGWGVKDGKIYVCGGRSALNPVCGSEMYDPKEDAWSPVTAISSVRFGQHVITVGEELFLHNGMFYVSDVNRLSSDFQDACFAELYHPLKNEWKVVEHFTREYCWGNCWGKVLTVGGKFHRLTKEGIEVYDNHANSWGTLQPFSFGVPEPNHFFITGVYSAVDVDNEVLALVDWRLRGEEDDEDDELIPDEIIVDMCEKNLQEGACLIRSQGLGGKKKEIVWHRLKSSICVGDYPSLMFPIRL